MQVLTAGAGQQLSVGVMDHKDLPIRDPSAASKSPRGSQNTQFDTATAWDRVGKDTAVWLGLW